MSKKKPSLIGETARTVIFAVIIAFFIRVFAYEPFNIPSGSMIPTLLVGDYLFDLLCGKNAGAKTVLICTNKDYPDFIDQADFAIHHLNELTHIIDQLENHQPTLNEPRPSGSGQQ